MPKLIINNREIDRIPLNEYYLEDTSYKGLVFIQHGYMSTKEWGTDYLALPLARSGYFVVSIDAYKHGERLEEPYITKESGSCLKHVPAVIKWTALDIINLHKHHYSYFNTFDMIGVSLGGMIAYYVATKTNKVGKLVPVISTPNIIKIAEHSLRQNGIDPSAFLGEEATKFLKSIDTVSRVDKLSYDELFILIGEKDSIVPCQDSIDFYEKYKNDKMMLKIYDIDHNVDREMQNEIFSFIEKQKDNQ